MIKLKIVTPYGLVAEEEVDMVTAPGDLGEVGILPGHIPMITGMRIGELSTQYGKKIRHFAVNEGYLEVFQDAVSIITKTCEESHTIDVKMAKEALENAQQGMKDAGDDPKELKRHKREIVKAEIRLKVADRKN